MGALVPNPGFAVPPTGAPTALADHSDHRLARDLAARAATLLLEVRADGGPDPKALARRGDRRSHEMLVAALHDERPQDAVLSEEGRDDVARLAASRVWIVDPLDGSREFGEVPRDDWAVHVALAVDGVAVVGAVARPARGDVLATDAPPVVPPRAAGPIRLAVSRTRPPSFVMELAEELHAELVPMGSAGIKAAAILDGTVDAYVHAGGQYEWDSAAPVALAAAAGLHTSRIDGSPLRYNCPDPLLPDLLVARSELAARILSAINRPDRMEE